MQNQGLKILVHASAFFAPFLVPFIVFLISEDQSVKKTAVQAVLFQLVMTVLIIVAAILSIFLIGLPVLLVLFVALWIVPIVGIVRAVMGEEFNYPIVGMWYQ